MPGMDKTKEIHSEKSGVMSNTNYKSLKPNLF